MHCQKLGCYLYMKQSYFFFKIPLFQSFLDQKRILPSILTSEGNITRHCHQIKLLNKLSHHKRDSYGHFTPWQRTLWWQLHLGRVSFWGVNTTQNRLEKGCYLYMNMSEIHRFWAQNHGCCYLYSGITYTQVITVQTLHTRTCKKVPNAQTKESIPTGSWWAPPPQPLSGKIHEEPW